MNSPAIARSQLSSFLPDLLQEVLGSSHDPDSCAALQARGVVLMADISGFTALSERLCARGPDGIEELTEILNATFGQMVDSIAGHGGDIIRFAGDAPIAVWWVRDTEDLGRSLRAAAACGWTLQRDFGGPHRLTMRVGIGVGELVAVAAGGVADRWELVVAGSAIADMAAAIEVASPGEVVLSPEAAGHLPSETTRSVSRGFRKLSSEIAQVTPKDSRTNPPAEAGYRAFVPRSVLERLDAGQSRWLAELRRVTVLFAKIHGIDIGVPEAPERLKQAFRTLQKEIYPNGGGINQFLMDDKGLTVVAAWGLPGATHEDDAHRALLAARASAAAFAAIGLGLSIGIATGQVYSGSRGNDRRREYAMIGDTVNLSARLMVKAEGRILCDTATQSAAPELPPYVSLEVGLKGKAGRVPVFVHLPGGSGTVGIRPALKSPRQPVELVGREQEREAISLRLQRLVAGDGGVLWIEGEAGIGKSVLIAEVQRQAGETSLSFVLRQGDRVGNKDPYLAWRGVLVEIMSADSSKHLLELLSRRHADDEDVISRLPLLGPLTGLDIPSNEVTRQLGPEAHAGATRDLVVRLLDKLPADRPLVLAFDNGQWLDSASWALLRVVARRLPRVLTVIGTRPFEMDTSSDPQMLRSADPQPVIVEGLESEEILRLALRRSGARELTPEVAGIILEKAGGHPLFASELIATLVDSKWVRVVDGICMLRSQTGNRTEQPLPDTLQGILQSRIDRLSPEQQLTLKVASAIGTVFDYRMLEQLHPATDESSLRQQLSQMEQLDLVALDNEAPLTYRFQHALVRDVAYGLMVAEQRSAVHSDAARWLEENNAEAPPWALLAHHWTRTREDAESLRCLERAGVEANEVGAPGEANQFFADAHRLAEESHETPVDSRRKAGWDYGQSLAAFAVGDLAGSRFHAEAGLGRVGRPIPRGSAGWYPRFAIEVTLQIANRLWKSDQGEPASNGWDRLPMDLLAQLSVSAFYQQDMFPTVVAGLAAINQAERHRMENAAGQAYSMLGYIAAVVGLEKLAERWWSRAADQPESKSRIEALTGRAFNSINHTRWSDADGYLDEAETLARRSGDGANLESVLMLRSYVDSFHRTPRVAEETGEEILGVTRTRESLPRALWGHLVIAGNALERGDYEAARDQLMSGEASLEVGDAASTQAFHAQLADNYCNLGDLEAARQRVDLAYHEVQQSRDFGMGNYYADGSIVRTSLALAQITTGDRQEHLDRARYSLKRLHKASRVYAYFKPRTARLEGDYWFTTGNTSKAMKWWHRALESALRCEMPLETALAYEQLSRPGFESAQEHRKQAIELFARLECTGPLRRLREQTLQGDPQ